MLPVPIASENPFKAMNVAHAASMPARNKDPQAIVASLLLCSISVLGFASADSESRSLAVADDTLASSGHTSGWSMDAQVGERFQPWAIQ